MDLLLISQISLAISLVTFFVIGMVKFYQFAYERGYSHGHHSGFTHGLYKAQEIKNKRKVEYGYA
jgi:hypothetical protein